MKSEKWITMIQAMVLAFLLSFGATACLVTGFGMHLTPGSAGYLDDVAWLPVNLASIAIFCGISAIVFSLCATFKMELVPLGLTVLAGGFLWKEGTLSAATEALLTRISQVYHNAYGWDVMYWSGNPVVDVDMTIALCLVGVLVGMVVAWTICRKQSAFFAVIVASLPVICCLVITDRVPEMVYLFLFLLGLGVLILSQTLRRQNAAEGNTLAALVTAPVALVLLLLFFLMPQKSYVLPEKIDTLFSAIEQFLEGVDGPNGQLGYDVTSQGQIDLEKTGVRLGSKAKVMEVTADTTGTLYLRGRAYDIYDGQTWISSGQSSSLGWPQPHLLSPAGEVTITTYETHQDLYVPYYQMDLENQTMRQHVLNKDKLTTYSYSLGILTEQAIRANGKTTTGYGPEYTQLPEATQIWANRQIQQYGLNKATTYATAQAIASYVRNSASYNTWTRRMPAGSIDFARWFILFSDSGYCVHFATASAVLLRAAKIPARYVTGYMVQTVAGETVTVEQSDAHAWVEYWIKDVGWIVLESTPSVDASAESTEATADTAATRQTDPTQNEASQNASLPTEQPTQLEETDPSGAVMVDFLWIALPLLAVLALLIQWRVRVAAKAKKHPSPNQQALAQWQRVVQLSRLTGQRPNAELFQLAQKAKFSQHTLTAQELALFDAYLRKAVRLLKKKPLLYHIYYRLILAIW